MYCKDCGAVISPDHEYIYKQNPEYKKQCWDCWYSENFLPKGDTNKNDTEPKGVEYPK